MQNKMLITQICQNSKYKIKNVLIVFSCMVSHANWSQFFQDFVEWAVFEIQLKGMTSDKYFFLRLFSLLTHTANHTTIKEDIFC